MSNVDPLLARNRVFAATDARTNLGIRPRTGVFVITCLDPRVDPAAVLGLELGDAPVIRNAGGRVTEAVVRDLAFISYMGEKMAAEGPLFEVAVIHHTQCGTAALSNQDFRDEFEQRTGYDDDSLARAAVLDPEQTVRLDVEKILSAPQASPRITVSGHVYDLESGLVRTIVAPSPPHPERPGVPA